MHTTVVWRFCECYCYDCVACRNDQFKCHNTGRCISAKFFYCDGDDDCGDASDEPENCSEWQYIFTRAALAMLACPSVCQCFTRLYCIKTAKRRITQTPPRDSLGTLAFWRQKSLVDDPPSPWNLPFQTPQFRQISAHSASTVRAGEKTFN